MKSALVFSPEVAAALASNSPIVALESTIISHGLPRPSNLNVAREVEAIVREHGATPATIAILDGVVHIGLTDEQLVDMLRHVGFEGKTLRSACAIAKAESNGRPLAFNGNVKTGDSSYGVFQINMLGELGSDRREKFELDSNAELLNPVVNAQIALHMTKGGKDWSSWSSVNGKRYQEWYNKYPCKK
jgi:pseudouridine-5'-phosphate glycosidase